MVDWLIKMAENLVRMTDKTRKPTEKEILDFIGEQTEDTWVELTRFIDDQYSIAPETIFYGVKYDGPSVIARVGRLCVPFSLR